MRIRTLWTLVMVSSCGLAWSQEGPTALDAQSELSRSIGDDDGSPAAQTQKVAVEATEQAIRKLGGSVRYEYASDLAGVPVPKQEPAGPPRPGHDSMSNIVGIHLDRVPNADAALVHANGLAQLERLSLSNSLVTDAGLERIKGLTQLRALYLVRTNVTDMGLEHLKGLTGLELLWIHDTKITDAGLKCLVKLKQLQWLNLEGTEVTDAGLEHLRCLVRDYSDDP